MSRDTICGIFGVYIVDKILSKGGVHITSDTLITLVCNLTVLFYYLNFNISLNQQIVKSLLSETMGVAFSTIRLNQAEFIV